MNQHTHAASSCPVIELDDVSVSDPRTGRMLLQNISISIRPGERVLLRGDSGSGKSTLLDVIAGVIPHSVPLEVTGTVMVGGRNVAEQSVAELSRTVGLVPQSPDAALCLPIVEDEIALTLENHGVAPQQMPQRIADLLEAVGAPHLMHRRTRSLSGGQAQRVATVAALAAHPQVILADEPTSMLDSTGLAETVRLLDALAGPQDVLLLVEHRVAELAALGTLLPQRTLLMDAGRLIDDDASATLLSRERFEPTEPTEPAEPAELWRSAQSTEELGPVLLHASNLGVTRNKDTQNLFNGLDFTLRAGQRVAVLGPNGAGKTSLLLALARVIPLATGRVEGEQPVMVFQNPEHQFLHTTVGAELRNGATQLDDAAEQRLADLVTRLGLDRLMEANPFRLSGGEQRRVSVAAAVMMLDAHGGVLLADEPTFGLDRTGTTAVLEVLAQLPAAVVMVTHDHHMARDWATDMVELTDDAEVNA